MMMMIGNGKVSGNIRAEMQKVKVVKYDKESDQIKVVQQNCKKEGKKLKILLQHYEYVTLTEVML